MTRRRKLKSVEISLAKTTLEIHDRMAIDAPKQLRVAPVDVQDPYNPDETIRCVRSTRDPLTWMHSRGAIDEPQRGAGEHWRKCFYRCQFGIGSIDTTKEAVDGGKTYEPLPDFKAFEFLARCREELGKKGHFVIQCLLANNLFPKDIAALYGANGANAIRNYTWFARDCLQIVSLVYTVRS